MKGSDPTIQHSTGRPFATWGCGYIAYNACRAAYRRDRLAGIIAPSFAPSDIPDSLIHTTGKPAPWASKIPYRIRVRFSLDFFLTDNAFDLSACKLVKECGIFHGWSHQAYFQMKRAHSLGAKTVIERPNSHPLDMNELVTAEQRKYGFKGRNSGPFELAKCIDELEMADRIIVCSQFAKDSHIRRGIPEEKISVINYGVDTQTFSPGPRAENTFRVVYCGMVCLRKGPQYLLEAWKKLGLKDAELLIIGMVLPDAVKLMEDYRDLPGLKVVGHVDSREQLAEMYRQGDVFVFPSVEDGFGMVVTEAMSCGLPVIISENTGAKDVVKHGVNGYIVPTYDVDQTSELILRFYKDRSLSRQLGVQARNTALENTWDNYGSKLMAVYDDLLNRRTLGEKSSMPAGAQEESASRKRQSAT